MDKFTFHSTYAKSRLILLPVDPYMIHAYWEIAPDDLRRAMKQAESAQPVLRFYKSDKITDEDGDWFDIEIDLRSRNWYAHLWSAEDAYHADLGLRQTDGTMIRVVRSRVVRMPRPVPAIAVDQHFMRVKTESETAQREIVQPSPPASPPAVIAPTLLVAPPVLREASQPEKTIPKPIDSRNIISEQLRELYASVERVRGSHVPQPSRQHRRRKPTPSMAIPKIDLSGAAEKKFEAGLPSSPIERNQPGGSSSRK